MIDAKAFGAELAEIVKTATAPLLARIEALEGQVKSVEARPLGVTEEALIGQLEAAEARAKAHADEAMQKAMAAMPGPVEMPEMPELPDIAGLVADAVKAAVEALPEPQPGKDGKNVSPEDVAPMIADAVSKAVSALPVAKDGTGLAGALIDREGNLVITLTNGEVQKLGVVVGKDADPAAPGRDGLGFEDLSFEFDEHGRVTAKFQRGDLVKSVRLPGIVDRGPFKSGESYEKGDAVSYGGSLWIAQDATDEKPDGGKGWRLAVKKGRDARTS